MNKKINERLMFILIMLLVCATAFFIFEKWITYKYQAELLLTPCELCMKLNEKQHQCIKDCFAVRVEAGDKNALVINWSKVNESFSP